MYESLYPRAHCDRGFLQQDGEAHMPLKIAICDDSPADTAYVSGLVDQWAAMRELTVQTDRFESAEVLLFHYEENRAYDILLLDIEMPGMDGVSMARTIRRDNEAVQIVFITGYSDYIAEGYDVAALHYLLKPVSKDKLFLVLDRALEKCRQNEKCLLLELPGEIVRLPMYQIRYLDVRQNYVTVHAKQDYTFKRPLAEFERELSTDFCRAGRSMILNLKHIRRVTRSEVYLDNGQVLPLPRGAYETLNRAIIAGV